MQRVFVPVVTAVLIAGPALMPTHATAQSGRHNRQSGATATGNAWMNENNFDYNRQHWLSSSRQSSQSPGSSHQVGRGNGV